MSVHYDAFISYRHAPLDSKIAGLIQHKLERAHIPKAIRQKTGKNRFQRIFRDKEELPISIDINDNLINALRNSDFLIVICSTNTASSVWVQREIEEFLKTHSKDRVLTVLADGEPQDVIPEILQFRDVETVDADGQTVVTQIPTEPLSCDFRLYPKKQREEFPRLMAAMLGCTYDDLRQRQRRRQRRQLFASFLAVLLLISGIAIYALDRAARIQEEARNTQIAQSRYLSQISDELLQSGHRETAIQVALAALPGEGNEDRPLVTEALYALNNAVYTYRQAKFNDFIPEGTTTLSNYIWWDVCSPSGSHWMAMDGANTLHIFDMQTNTEVKTWTQEALHALGDGYIQRGVFISDTRVVLFFQTCCVCWDLATDTQLWAAEYPNPPGYISNLRCIAAPDTESSYAVYQTTDTLRINCLDADGNISQFSLPYESDYYGYVETMALNDDATQLAVIINESVSEGDISQIWVIDLAVQQADIITPEQPNSCTVKFQGDYLYYSCTNHDAYSFQKGCQYAIGCYDTQNMEQRWVHTGEQYIVRDYNDYTDLLGSMTFEQMQPEQEGELRPVLLVVLGGRITVLDPESGERITYAEFSSEIMSLNYYAEDRVYLVLKNGDILQYVLDVDLTGEIGSIDSVISAVAYYPTDHKYALAARDSDVIVWMTNQLQDDSGVPLATDYPIASAIYTAETEQELRILCEKRLDGEEADYRFTFSRIHETEPFAVSDWFGGMAGDCYLMEDENGCVAYWLYEADTVYLMGWNLSDNACCCNIPLTSTSLYSVDILSLHDGKIYLFTSGGIHWLDPVTAESTSYEIDGYLYDAVFTPDKTQLVLMQEDYETYETYLSMLDADSLSDAEAIPQRLDTLPQDLSTSIESVVSPDGTRLVCPAADSYRVYDLTTRSLCQVIPVSCSSNYAATFLSEQILAVCGDSGYLSTWNVDTGEMIMEDRYIFSARTLYAYDGILFTQNSSGMHLYRTKEDGTFAREISVEDGLFSVDGTELSTLNNGSITLYDVYTLEELTAKAWALVDNKPLSEDDRIKYFIEG